MEPDSSDQSLGGGGTVEESGMTLLSAAAGVFDDDLDDDLDDVPLGNACSLDGDSCESCQ